MKKILNIFIIAIILLYIGKVSINTISGRDKTVPLKYGSLSESIKTDGYIVKDETVINSPIDGNLKMIVKEGTRVPKNKEIAEVVSQSFDKEKLDELNSVIKKIQDAKSDKALNPYVNDIESLNSQIDELNKKYSKSSDSKVSSSNIKKKIDDLENKKEQILNNGPSSVRYLDDLYSQKKELENYISQNLYKIYSPEAGIVSYFFDDYEDALSINRLFNISYNDINAVKKEPEKPNESVKHGEPIIKLINNYDWYILAVLDNGQSKKLKEGSSVKVDIDDNSQLLYGNIIKIYSISNNSQLAVISMRDAYSDFSKKRKVGITLIINDYEGFIVPNSSIVNNNGKYGVYELGDNDLPAFKEVSIKAQNNENAIIESKDDSLKMYDQIIVNGKDYLKR